jgi:ABC-type glucose/galactose transport system permease subunit
LNPYITTKPDEGKKMNTQKNRYGVHTLDDADLEKVGSTVVGGIEFENAVELTGAILGIIVIVVGAFNSCMNPVDRKTWWTTFMSNFARASVAAAAGGAGDIESQAGDIASARTLDSFQTALQSSASDQSAILSVQTTASSAQLSCEF